MQGASVLVLYVGHYSYGEWNYCDRLHILITFINYIITPLLTSTHEPVLARAPEPVLARAPSSNTNICITRSMREKRDILTEKQEGARKAGIPAQKR